MHLKLLHGYQLNRITAVVPVGKNLQSTGYNVGQSVAAIGSGGRGEQGSSTDRRPTSPTCPSNRPTSSSRPLGEQLGFVGRGRGPRPARRVVVAAASQCPARPRRLRPTPGGGLLTLVAFSVFENAGMAMQIMPVAGIPLPFLSYGGSATVAFFSTIGIALSVQLRAQR